MGRTVADCTRSDADLPPKRRAIVDASEHLFLRHGYGATSMDAVARQASVSKATLYAHFTSKDLLFATIVGERGITEVLDDSDFPDPPVDARACLTRIGYRWLEFMMRPRTLAIYRIAVAESARFPELGRAFYENGPVQTRNRFARWTCLLRDRGIIEADDLSSAAVQFFALLKGSMFLRASLAIGATATEPEIVEAVAVAVDTWLRAFGRRIAPPAG